VPLAGWLASFSILDQLLDVIPELQSDKCSAQNNRLVNAHGMPIERSQLDLCIAVSFNVLEEHLG